ncbi:Predicted membrane protein [uncultured Roseburia sp.]|uniref:Phosphate-starvation-inducible PsiE family protein n=1 Tax=Brotonthovivens ammoniilytica TaxID=2981725 RepID=A0ABT2TG97_9FIRM|nr:phosphate-starvation-inducible PsiE family protein [Brotonthovivens ammoniilytica]MCU6761203.1 phosphate-starvation-inducible PsiE family protein [Brotonthovivens ammoniilytica]SCI21809.1 Predicted membrane protein [uncultured Roseburia sp.]
MKNTHKHFIKYLESIGRAIELILAAAIIAIVVLSIIQLFYDLTQIHVFDMHADFFSDFLGKTLALVVGVEFIKMLCEHSADSVIEVLLVAISRQMVVEHLDSMQTLIGVIAVFILFAARWFFQQKNPRKKKSIFGRKNSASAIPESEMPESASSDSISSEAQIQKTDDFDELD